MEDELEFFTDDSLSFLKRRVLDPRSAVSLDFATSEDTIGYNAYPCTSGLIVSKMTDHLAMGIALSHPVTCHFVDNRTFELIVMRSVHH